MKKENESNMKEVELMNIEQNDVSEDRLSLCYYAINRDENYEENYEEPVFEVASFERCCGADCE